MNSIFASGSPNPNCPDVIDIDAKELLEKQSQVVIIDVREPDEFTGELGHIAGARLVVLNTLPEHIHEIPNDRPVVFVCKAGGRSTQAANFAFQNGLKQIFNLRGGMMRWNQLGLPAER